LREDWRSRSLIWTRLICQGCRLFSDRFCWHGYFWAFLVGHPHTVDRSLSLGCVQVVDVTASGEKIGRYRYREDARKVMARAV
jgi:hypothetical protein